MGPFMRFFRSNLVLLSVTLGLSGCASSGLGLTRTEPVPAGVEALRASLTGPARNVGLSADAQRKALEAEFQALQYGAVGQAVSWQAGNARGEIVPTQLYQIGSQECRGYTHVISRGTNTVRQVGSACRDQSNVWIPVA